MSIGRILAVSFLSIAAVPLLAHAGPVADVSFANDIQPIFDARCIGCHSDASFLPLTAGSSRANLVGQPTTPSCMKTAPDSIYVVPFDPPSSMLWLKTRPDDARCGVPMPYGTEGLGVIAPDEFALLEAWIAQGAQDN